MPHERFAYYSFRKYKNKVQFNFRISLFCYVVPAHCSRCMCESDKKFDFEGHILAHFRVNSKHSPCNIKNALMKHIFRERARVKIVVRK